MKQISGGVCAATGFSASGVHCGIRKNKTKRRPRTAGGAVLYTSRTPRGTRGSGREKYIDKTRS